MTGLTKPQKAIYDFIADFVKEKGYSPSYREISAHFSYSSLGTVHKHVAVLKRKGVLSSEAHCGRSLKVSPPSDNGDKPGVVAVPFIGQLTATSGVETFPKIHTLSLPEFMVANPDTTYVLRARGEAWIDEQIADGDLLIIDAQREASPNETVIARIHESYTTIKRVFPEGQYVRLVGGRAGSESTLLKAEHVEIQGIIVGIIRLFG